MALLCTFPHVIHQWNKWQVVEEGHWMIRKSFRGEPVAGSERCVGKIVTQERTCKCCNFKQIKVTKVRTA